MLIPINEKTALNSPDLVFGLAVKALKTFDAIDQMKEIAFAIGVNNQNELLYCDAVHIGSLNYSVVHPREIFRRAIEHHAASIFFVHNHPSGCLEPSEEDREVTRILKQAGEIISITLLDSMIIAPAKSGQFNYRQIN